MATGTVYIATTHLVARVLPKLQLVLMKAKQQQHWTICISELLCETIRVVFVNMRHQSCADTGVCWSPCSDCQADCVHVSDCDVGLVTACTDHQRSKFLCRVHAPGYNILVLSEVHVQ